jgi:hypothetical protein
MVVKTKKKKTEKKKTEKKKTEKKKTEKKKTENILIKNNTPKEDILLDKMIERGIKEKVPESLNNQIYFNRISNSNTQSLSRSYSPQINKYLVSISHSPVRKFSLCNYDLLTINIGTEDKPNCVKYTDKKAREFFLKNLKNRDVDCSQLIAPKQIVANCWFNVFFVNFFISDKGRKFFKFFRQLMIEGRTSSGEKIQNDLAKAFFLLNIAIEASYNRVLKNIAYLLNTNLLIIKIYNAINEIKSKKGPEKKANAKNNTNIKKIAKIYDSNIPNINDSGNPLLYYLSIMNYLNINPVNINIKTIYTNDQLETANYIKYTFLKQKVLETLPEILVLEIYGTHEKINKKKNKIIIEFEDSQVIYVLDSIVIRDNIGEHFCSVLTCNGEELVFEGGSYNRLSPFKWKSLINKNLNWSFISKDHYYDLEFNFTKGYQLLFYYRI